AARRAPAGDRRARPAPGQGYHRRRMSIAEAHRQQLEAQGWVAIERVVPPSLRTRLVERIEALFAEEGDRAGSEWKQEDGARRLANLADKGDVFLEAMLAPVVLAHVEQVLGPR